MGLREPAHYFPLEARPLEMRAGLLPFGSDFGNGARDAHYFQQDSERDQTLALKQRAPSERRFLVANDALAQRACEEALAFMHERLAIEHPSVLEAVLNERDASDGFDAIARHVQEDFAILNVQNAQDRTVALDVRFPSGWRPERLKNASFAEIHQAVPGFPKNDKMNAGMVRAMIERGPFVRFVWTCSPSETLDQHPDAWERKTSWPDAKKVFFRVERQVTVPLRNTKSSLFLIRTYVREISRLSKGERERLQHALCVMPEKIRAYKSLPSPQRVRELFARYTTKKPLE